jgi:glycine C-acetyltransferase
LSLSGRFIFLPDEYFDGDIMVDRNPTSFLREEYLKLVEQGLDWKIRNLGGPSSTWSIVDGRKVLMLCSNNYLGLANHPRVREAAKEAIDKYGVGAGSDRSIAGNMDIHMELEETLAKFKRAPASLVFQTGYMANEGLIPQLIDRGDLVVSDELNHGSIIDGVRLSRADRAIYKHCDMDDLARVLDEAEKHDPPYKRILIVTDGVFSMDGDIAPLDRIAKLAGEHGAMVYVDDAHGEGVLGEGGRGIVSHYNLSRDEVHIEMGTFSKAFGVIGGHITGSEDLYKFAYNKARTWLLSGAMTPVSAAACKAAIEVLQDESWRVDRLWENTEYFKKAVEDLGYNTGKTQTPIIPLIVGESYLARKLAERLYEEGIFALPIFYPMVPRGTARIRLQMNTDLTREDLDFAIEKLETIGKELGIIS